MLYVLFFSGVNGPKEEDTLEKDLLQCGPSGFTRPEDNCESGEQYVIVSLEIG